jgi:PhoH-like ATPase
LRGDNIDNAFVIISEGQNIPRSDMRSILSRMGENTNVVIEGDVKQIDNHICNEFNNGLN